MDYEELPEFSREKKRLGKKYISLADDIKRLKGIIPLASACAASKHWNCLHREECFAIYKIRLACRSLQATRLRVIYAHHSELQKVVLIEIYFKGDKENEDRARIAQYVKDQQG